MLYCFNENVGTTADGSSPTTFDLLGPSNPQLNAGRLEHVLKCLQLLHRFARMKGVHGWSTHSGSF